MLNSISNLSRPIGLLCSFVLVLLLQACTGTDDTPKKAVVSTAPKSCENATTDLLLAQADAQRGGRLYDEWWAELNVAGPTTTNILFATQTTNTLKGTGTWRCKECHGWDYKGDEGAYGDSTGSHYTGFSGIKLAAIEMTPAEVFCAIRDGVNILPGHKFDSALGLKDQDILDLTKFVRDQVNTDTYIDSANKATGTASAGQAVFITDAGCGSNACHSPAGLSNIEGGAKTLGLVATENPWEVLHKIQYGQPGSGAMQSFTDNVGVKLNELQIRDVLAYAQSLVKTGSTVPPPVDTTSCVATSIGVVTAAALTAADPLLGGRLYDQWWTALGVPAPTGEQGLWASRAATNGVFANIRTGADSWRCKECHGWDYLGKDGAYAVGSSHFTGFAGVVAAKIREPIDVFCAIKDGVNINKPLHKFPTQLTDANILHLTKFILDSGDKGVINVSSYINANGSVNGGDATAGSAVFSTTAGCAASTCHGTTGTLNIDGGVATLGQLSKDNPWEVLHKIRMGHPGSTVMPSFLDTAGTVLTSTQIKNVLAFSQTLPGINVGVSTCSTDNAAFVSSGLANRRAWDGGKLYDNWPVLTPPATTLTDHPLWANRTVTTNVSTGAATWRCKECHGWDYKGKDGAYATGSHATGFPGIRAAITSIPKKPDVDIFCAIADGEKINAKHKFLNTANAGVGLTREQILDLTQFIVAAGENGLVDSNDFITFSTKLGSGVVANGATIYNKPTSGCTTCHGATGADNVPGSTLGALALANPWEVLHKIRYGHPGSNPPMPAYITDTATYELNTTQIKDVLTYTQTLTGGTTGGGTVACSTEAAAFVTANYTAAVAWEGGQLYDKWWAKLNVGAPTNSHALWDTRAKNSSGQFINAATGADSWRCKECHGWDYKGSGGDYNTQSSHYTGFKGLMDVKLNKTPIQVFCAIRDGEGIDAKHQFNSANTGTALSDAEILKLTKFILDGANQGMVNTDTYINPTTKLATGTAATGAAVYSAAGANCASSLCHGPTGLLNAGGITLGQLADENPWEVLHKVRNGNPGTTPAMPQFVTTRTEVEFRNLLAYMQNDLPGAATVATTCRTDMKVAVERDIVNAKPWDGGRYYDNWVIQTRITPTGNHPLWSSQNSNTRTGVDTWRCKECHGWDYKGKDGVYAPGNSHYTGFTGILGASSKPAVDIFCAIRDGEGINPLHAFKNSGLTDFQIVELTSFIKGTGENGMLDSNLFVDPLTSKGLGDAVLGKTAFEQKATCSICHGLTGAVNIGNGLSTLGDLATGNPTEVVHKIRYGNPGSFMPQYIDDSLISSTGLTTNDVKNVLTYAQTLPLTSTGGGTVTTPATCKTDKATFVSTNLTTESVSQGGALYDKWWTTLGFATGPTTVNPVFATQSTNTNTGETTWRCKECHGWDYKGKDGAYATGSHATGFAGVMGARAKSPIDVFCAISQGTTAYPAHKFSSGNATPFLTDQAILQLTKFITDGSKGVIDTDFYINPTTAKPVNGNLTQGAQEFTNCSSCHGATGTSNAAGTTLGALANANPWEVFHKIRYGHPGSNPEMPKFVDGTLTLASMVNILTFAQSLPTTGGTPVTPPVASEAATIVLGGLLYDKWFTQKGMAAPLVDNPIWATQTTNTRTGADTWRCKECHGWDYKGKDGQYGPGSSHYTGFAGLFTIANDPLEDEAAIVSILNGVRIGGTRTHDFSAVLSVTEIAALAKFVKKGIIDTALYISPSTGRANGDRANGLLQFTYVDSTQIKGNCSQCHGVNGREINFGTTTAPEFLAEVGIREPWELLHKARFGQPGSIMPSMLLNGLSIGSTVDVLTHVQTLRLVVPPPRPRRDDD